MTAAGADGDGDGIANGILYDAAKAEWSVYRSAGRGLRTRFLFGPPGSTPRLGDYDGDGTIDLAVYERAAGGWLVQTKVGGSVRLFGQRDLDVSVPGRYQDAGRLQLAVFRPETGQWFVDGIPGARGLENRDYKQNQIVINFGLGNPL